MKKISILSVAFLAVVCFSCSKEKEQPVDYANYVSGDVNISEGNLKSTPVGVTRNFTVYHAPVGGVMQKVDGSEFLPGSAPALDWINGNAANPNGWEFSVSQPVHITYCPTIPLRLITKTKVADGTVAYLGIKDVTPNQQSFPILMTGRRLGDVLTINTDALTRLPGYKNMHFEVIYVKSIINVDATASNSTPTDAGWPSYVYESGDPQTVTVPIAGNQSGDVTVYDGLDGKITGVITIKVYVDDTVITTTTNPVGIGFGLALTLTTDKVGFYDSGNMDITDKDITIERHYIGVN